jgi:sulfonate transport system ATP-binding protein
MTNPSKRRGAHVRIEGLTKSYGARPVLHGIDLTLEPSELVTVVGQSGSGKSTLLRILCGLEAPSAGQVRIAHGLATQDDGVRVVFQEPRLLPWRSALDNVRVGQNRDAQSERAAREVLCSVGLGDRLHDYPGSLSGGQKQRVSLARALLHEPALMLLDEPFGALDALTRIGAQRLVEKLWQERGFTGLLVTHDVEEAVLLGDRVLVFDEGRVVAHVNVDLPRPRTRANPEVGRLATVLLDVIFAQDSEARAARISTEPAAPLASGLLTLSTGIAK